MSGFVLVFAMRTGRPPKSDAVHLAVLMGLCSLLGVYLILTTPVITRDGVFYISQAWRLGQDPAGVSQEFPPGYPFLLRLAHEVAVRLAGGDSPGLWAVSAQSVTLLCRVLALIPLYFLGRLLVGAADSFWALLVLIILPYPAEYGSDVLREWPYVLFLSTGLLLLYWGLLTKRWWVLALVGLDAGLGYLIRPECGQLVVYALLGLAFVRGRGLGSGSQSRSIAIGDPSPLGAASARSAAARRASGAGQNSALGPPKAGFQPMNHRQDADATKNRGQDALATHGIGLVGGGLLLAVGFAIPIVPYVRAGASLVPHQVRPVAFNSPPFISAVGSKAAADDPLEFEVRVGESLELPIVAADREGDPLTFSLAGVPLGSRPAYEFRSRATGADFWTLSPQDRDLLLGVHSTAWDYEGIAWYAYARPGARRGLQPVYRFWSPTRERHFYTMSESEKEAILAESTSDSWSYEGAVFYAYGEAAHPTEAIAVYRFWSEEDGFSWGTASLSGMGTQKDEVAWYVHPAGQPPAGVVIEDRVFRWRPTATQPGEHQVSIIVTDGKLPCCQLVVIRVTAGPSPVGHWDRDEGFSPPHDTDAGAGKMPAGHKAGTASPPQALLSMLQQADLRRLAQATNDVFGAIGENLMVIPLLPWILGLYYGLKHRAGTLERVLILSVLIVNIGLMFTRHMWIASGGDRRHSVALIALTIFYLPAGLDVVTQWLNRIHAFRGRRASGEHRSPWFYLLVLGVIVLCAPKLVAPREDKAGYRAAGEWLWQNTQTEAVVAVPDSRIGFYSGRQPLLYEQHPDWRQADYVVQIAEGGRTQVPEGWTQAYSVPVGPKDDREVVIYKTPNSKHEISNKSKPPKPK